MNRFRSFVRKLGIDVQRYNAKHLRVASVSLKPNTPEVRGHALLAYRLKPFLLRPGEPVPASHTNFAETVLMAEVLCELGFEVDVIDFENEIFVPSKCYNLLVSNRMPFSRYAGLVGEKCVKLAHLDVSHWLFNNSSALARCCEVREKRGVALNSYRHIEENRAIEDCDSAVMLGNAFTAATYNYSGKSVRTIPVPVVHTYSKPEKDYDRIRKNFLWFGSRGFVQKGLDLVLEAFRDMPDYNLTVCGPIDREKDFEAAFHRELYETKNIKTAGWVDVRSEQFRYLAGNHIGLVYPSCAEGQAGAVVVCMHAGMVPIASVQSGVDLRPEYGISLDELSVSEIKSKVMALSAVAPEKLEEMSLGAWQHAQRYHTGNHYKTAYREIVEKVLAER